MCQLIQVSFQLLTGCSVRQKSLGILSSSVKCGRTFLFHWSGHYGNLEKLLLSPEEMGQGRNCQAEVTDIVSAPPVVLECCRRALLPAVFSRLGASIAFPASIHMPSSGAQWGPPKPGALCH